VGWQRALGCVWASAIWAGICIPTDCLKRILSCADGQFRGTSKLIYRLIVDCYNLIPMDSPLISYTDAWLLGTILLITTKFAYYCKYLLI
jgi:hypothetical protein